MSITDEIQSGIKNIDRMVADMNATGGDTIYGRTIDEYIAGFGHDTETFDYRPGEPGWIRMTAYKARWEWHRDNPAPKPDPIERRDVVGLLESMQLKHLTQLPDVQGYNSAITEALRRVKGL